MPEYNAFKPKPFRPEMSAYWYLDRWPYLKFTIRESSSIFVAWFAVVMLMQINAISKGSAAYAAFQAWMREPLVIIANFIAFFFVVFHAVTWFMLVPRVFVRHLFGNVIPDGLAAAPNYGIWLVVSAVIALFALRII
jgi:fumarate reductase subunit C